ncbi:MAG: hypothetical protein AAGU77_09790, partial [Bacillota bacterium]
MEKQVWYKKWWVWLLGILVLGILIYIPFHINNIYYAINQASFTASDMLQFYGSILAFLGTIFLGALALWQNNRLSKTNQALAMLQLEEYTPYLV